MLVTLGGWAQTRSSLEITGQTNILQSTRQVTGEVTGASIQAARTGKDFHIIARDLPGDQTLQLELGFAELEFNAPGVRVFDLYVNDKPALVNFDILSEAGGSHRSIVKKFSITPPKGELDFHFKASLGEGLINFIRISGDKVDRLIAPPATVKMNAGLSGAGDEYHVSPDEQASLDVETAKIHMDGQSKSWNGGVPIGGIGTGKFEILPNGQFANFTINNSWDLPVLRPPGTFISVAAKAISSGGSARLLQINPTDSEGKGLFPDAARMKNVDFKGEFPYATWEFKDDKIPLEFLVNAWSPLIPGNLKDSSLPAGIINVVVNNPKNYPISVAVALSWEDLNGRGGSLLPGDQHGVVGRSTHQDAATSSITGFQISNDYLQKNREATFTGNYFVGTPIKGALVTRKLGWNPRGGSIPWWKQFSRQMRLDRIPAAPASISSDNKNGPTASSLCVSFNLAPNESRRVPFIVSWYFPQIVTLDSSQGSPTVETPDYADRFASSAGVASYVAENRVAMRKDTDEWTDLIARATVPEWLKNHVTNSLFPVKTNSVLLKSERFAMLESPADMKGMLGPVDLRLMAGDFFRSMFPQLEETELNLYARAQDASGRIPRYVGNIHGALAGFDASLLGTDWADPTASWILQVASYWRETGNTSFLESVKPAIVKAKDYLKQSLESGTDLQVPNAYSVSEPNAAASSSTRIDVLAALRASQELLDDNDTVLTQLINQKADEIVLKETTSTWAPLLSGDVALAQAGVSPLFGAQAKRDFLQKVFEQNFATKPVPLMDADSGSESPTSSSSFPALLQSSVGAAALSLGLPQAGMEPFVRMFQIAYAAQKNPWRQALRYDVPAAGKPVIRYHRSSMAAWSLWRGLSGVVMDMPQQRLYLDPHILENPDREMEIPVFTPVFWGWLKYHQKDSTGTLSIIKVMPDFTSSTLTQVATRLNNEGTAENLVNLPQPLVLDEGATLELKGWPALADGEIIAHTASTLAQPEDVSTRSLSLANETTTGSEESSVPASPAPAATSRELEQGQEMPPTPEQDEPIPAKSVEPKEE